MEWKDALSAVAATALVVWILYTKLRGAARTIREFRRSRTERTITYVALAAIATTAVSCNVIEAITKPPLHGPVAPGTLVASLGLGLLVYATLYVRVVRRPERDALERLMANRRCPRCAGPLLPENLHHPTSDARGFDPFEHWFHRCACGEMTLFKPDGSAVHVEVGVPDERGKA